MSRVRPGDWIYMLLSLAVALVLSVAPMPFVLQDARPLWLPLFIAYWAFTLPYAFRMSLAWLFGLVQDVLYGTVLGFHALLLVFIAFVVLSSQQRLRMYPLWQQAMFLTAALLIGQMVLFWLAQLSGNPPLLSEQLYPVLVSGLLWPWLCMIMRGLHRVLSK